MRTATHHRWADMPAERINAHIARRFITADHVTVARFDLARGGRVPKHAHEHEQVTCVLSGTLKFVMNGAEVLVGAGELLQIPAWAEHEVEVIDDAVAIDVFSPIRQDWIDGTDTYFLRE